MTYTTEFDWIHLWNLLSRFKMRLVIVCWLLHLLIVVLGKQCNVSRYQHPLKRAFSRRKRFVVFPNYCAMKITVAVGKALIAKHPTGNNLSLELSVYYPLPTTIEEWYPRRYRKKNKTAAKPKDDSGPVYFHESGAVIPNNWRFSGFSNKANQGMWKVSKVHYSKFLITPKPYYKDVLKWSPYQQRHWTKVNTSFPKYNFESRKIATKLNPLKNIARISHFQNTIDEDELFEKNHKFFRAHRDRRNLYNYIEKIGLNYGFDMKACILRAICETKRYLLPRGASLIQDIIRIAFTFPSEQNYNSRDEYSKANKLEKCEGEFDAMCPFSIIDMALFPDKVNKI